MRATEAKHGPLVDHLWSLGFTPSFKVHRLPIPVVEEGAVFFSRCELTATPDRGEARRLFSRKGPVGAEVMSNLPLEVFAAAREKGDDTLQLGYMESCARALFELLRTEAPALSAPPGGWTPFCGQQDTASAPAKNVYGFSAPGGVS